MPWDKIKVASDSFDAASLETGLECLDPSLTIQSMSEDADINVIATRFGLTGMLPARDSVPLVTNGDFVPELTYQQAMDILNAGRDSFLKMPADVRSRFDNDPAKFVDFCSDVEGNRAELERLGLAVPKPVVPETPKA